MHATIEGKTIDIEAVEQAARPRLCLQYDRRASGVVRMKRSANACDARAQGAGNFQLFIAPAAELDTPVAGPVLAAEAVESFAWSAEL